MAESYLRIYTAKDKSLYSFIQIGTLPFHNSLSAQRCARWRRNEAEAIVRWLTISFLKLNVHAKFQIFRAAPFGVYLFSENNVQLFFQHLSLKIIKQKSLQNYN